MEFFRKKGFFNRDKAIEIMENSGVGRFFNEESAIEIMENNLIRLPEAPPPIPVLPKWSIKDLFRRKK